MLADSELASIQQFAEQLALDAGEQIAKASASRYTGSNTKSDASKKNRVDRELMTPRTCTPCC